MIKLIFIFTIFLFSFANAEVVKKIEVTGNKRISSETVKVYGEIELNADYSADNIDTILKNLYQTEFFENVEITLSNNILSISVVEFPLINDILIEGEKANKIKDVILENLSSKKSGSFRKNSVSDDMSTIKSVYGSLGYNFVNVTSQTQELDEGRLNLIFLIDKGDRTKISKINFLGDKKVRERRLRDIIASEEHKFWKFLSRNIYLNYQNIELDKRLITNYYKSIGFYDIQVLSSNAEITKNNDTILTYTVNAGTRYRIKKIKTNVDKILDKDIFFPLEKDFNKIIGKYYSPFKVQKILDRLDILITSKELQFIEHSVSEIIEEDGIVVQINVFEGSKKLVERVDIIGNGVTDEDVIRSELLIDEGDPLNNLKIEKSISKLKSRNIFKSVDKKITDGSSPDHKKLEIKVEEKPTGEISAGAGYGTNGSTFSVGVSENNWLGRGVKLSTSIELDETSFRGGINYNNPNYNYSGNSLGYHISSSRNDKPSSGFENSTYSTGINTRFEQYKDFYLTPGISYTYDDLRVDSTATSTLKKQAGTYSEMIFDYNIESDKRDRSYAPTSGYTISFGQGIPLYADAPILRNSAAFAIYNSFTPNVIGAFKAYGSTVTGFKGEDVRLSRRAAISSKRLRGFEQGKIGPKDANDYIGGNYAAAFNFEASLPNLLPESTGTDIVLFLDAANLWGVDYDTSIAESNKIRSSFGLGASVLSPIGPLSFTIAQNISKADTDQTETFNFALGTTF